MLRAATKYRLDPELKPDTSLTKGDKVTEKNFPKGYFGRSVDYTDNGNHVRLRTRARAFSLCGTQCARTAQAWGLDEGFQGFRVHRGYLGVHSNVSTGWTPPPIP